MVEIMWADRREPNHCWLTLEGGGKRESPIVSGGLNSMTCWLFVGSECLKKSFMLPWSWRSHLMMIAILLEETQGNQTGFRKVSLIPRAEKCQPMPRIRSAVLCLVQNSQAALGVWPRVLVSLSPLWVGAMVIRGSRDSCHSYEV